MSHLTAKDRSVAPAVLPTAIPAARKQSLLAGEGTIASGTGNGVARPAAGNPGHECVTLPGTGLDAAAKSGSETVAPQEDQAA